MNNIFKLKHWQVFIILCTTYIISVFFRNNNFSIGEIAAFKISVFSAVITLILFFLWIMAIGLFLNNIKDNPFRFKKWILILAVLCTMIGYIELNLERLEFVGITFPDSFSMILTPFVGFGLFYTFINVPKSLKSIELGRKAKFSEWIIDAILLFVFPIGIWFVQPRLNRIYTVNEKIKRENKMN